MPESDKITISQEEYRDLLTTKFFLRKYLEMPSADGNLKRRVLRTELAARIGIKNYDGIKKN